MRNKTHRLIAALGTSGALLLGIGLGVAEAHVSQLEREALAAFEAEAVPVVLTPAQSIEVVSGSQARPAISGPYLIEVSVSNEEFMAARAAHARATL